MNEKSTQPNCEIQLTDRYQAMGIPYPEASTVCLGQCEGTGYVPISEHEPDARFKALWDAQHAKAHTLAERIRTIRKCTFLSWPRRLAILFEKCDGWHFVKCPDCGGSGKRSADRSPSNG